MKAIIFDIETIAQNEELLLARAPDFKLDSRLKDPEKIAESFAKKRNEYLEYAALDWKTAQVVLIGAGDSTQIQSMTGEKVDGETAGEEKRLIGDFFSLIAEALADGCIIAGHNVKS